MLRSTSWLLSAALLLGLAGCVSIPAPLKGEHADLIPRDVSEAHFGETVRWGGMIIDTQAQADRTCIEILALALNRDLRPSRSDQSLGRFIACREGFQEPAILSAGREVTVIGSLAAFETGQIGEFPYRYPVLNTDVVYLWPPRPEVIEYQRRYGPFYDPWLYPVPRGRWTVSGSVIIRR
jgi:outer membrane lipoprotein